MRKTLKNIYFKSLTPKVFEKELLKISTIKNSKKSKHFSKIPPGALSRIFNLQIELKNIKKTPKIPKNNKLGFQFD